MATTSMMDEGIVARLRDRLDEAYVHTRYRLQHDHAARSLQNLIDVWHNFMDPKHPGPSKAAQQAARRRLDELLAADMRNVEAGYYPREMLLQLPIARYLRLVPKALLEAPRMLLRRRRMGYDELPEGVDAGAYPKYYLRNFHWQTDGWFSDHSARMYDVAVETLFVGTADIMRRMMIPPIVDALRDVERPRVLDVACGTGRFLLQLHQAIPSAKLYGLDLSPNYVRYASELLDDVQGLSLVHDNAEKMPFGDETFDALSVIYLFHELPKDVRRNVVGELMRVVKPGGVVAVLASAQLTESAEISDYLQRFHTLYHEPYYKGYLKDPVEEMFAEGGFEVQSVEPHFISKVVVVRRPLS